MATERTFRPLFGRSRKKVQLSRNEGPDPKAAAQWYRQRAALEAEISRLGDLITARFDEIHAKERELTEISKSLRKLPKGPSRIRTLKQGEQKQIERELRVLRGTLRHHQSAQRRKNRQLSQLMK